MTKCDLAVKGKYVLPINSKLDIIKEGMVVISGNKIIDIGEEKEKKDKYQTEEIINAGNAIIMPGLINTHTHAAMTYFRGLADDLPLKEWLEKHIWPAEKKYVNPDFIYRGTKLACLEMIKSGTTCFNDMYYFYETVAEAAESSGMRAVVGEVLFNFSAPSYENINEFFNKFGSSMKKYKDNELINFALAPHSIYVCDKDFLIKISEFAKEYKLLIHIHVSETKDEVEECKKENGLSPVKYLDKINFLDNNILAAHSVWLDDDDLEIYKKRGVKVGHCPTSNMKLASGIMPAVKMQEKEIIISLGTDGAASNNTLDLFSTMKDCALLHKVSKLDPTVVNACQVVKMATINGAKALGLEDKIGSLEIGKRADLITINLDKPHLTPIYDPYSHLVYCVNGEDVNDVIINGRIVMRNREVKTIDEEKVLREVKSFKIN
ncbi:MAG: amidohydrolase [Patescibacteria group bacterium]